MIIEASTRLGALVIHNDPVPEEELWLGRSADVSIHTARFPTPRASGEHFTGRPAERMLSPGVARGLRQLADLGVHAIGYCFVSSSVFGGGDFDDQFEQLATDEAGGTPVITGGRALRDEVRRRVGHRDVVLVAPPWFSDETVAALIDYVEIPSIRVRTHRYVLGPEWEGIARPELFDAGARHAITGQGLLEQISALGLRGSELVVVPGSGMRSYAAQKVIAAVLGLETVSANGALLSALVSSARGAALVR
ncbi:hypothetical protein [Curtobacterium sp. VKM Ac-2852]|uniref:hypothetical protein n=1 Tax=Curtobacterium sp. VKM Ac-2852 TaxID=2739024 RepID=UPI00156373DE|nr:hypothetical protein [Curtobacterium sp. VKM Ac-2852]NQX22692.1 hypothetical protein [Curtobacterium sp. VKM Ac-2852]